MLELKNLTFTVEENGSEKFPAIIFVECCDFP